MNWYYGLISLCHTLTTPGSAPGLWPMAMPVLLFAMGLLGSVLHCGPMCGAFVLAQASDSMACIPARRLNERSRVLAGALPLYHLGRITTYAGLGAALSAGVSLLSRLTMLHALSGGLLLAASGLMALQALHRWFPAINLARGLFLWRMVRPFTARLEALGPWRHFATGLILGFLPCCLLGAALLAASSRGSPGRAAVAMACFGLGTVPLLALLGIMGGRGIAVKMRPVIPVLLLLAAALLAGIGIAQIESL